MKKSVIRKYLILSILTGVIMGIIFPIFTSFFMHPKSETSQFIFIASCVMAGIFVGGLSFFIGKITIIRNLQQLNTCFEVVSEGNLTTSCPIESDDEIGEIVGNLQKMTTSLRQIVRLIANKSQNIETRVQEAQQGFSILTQQVNGIYHNGEVVSIETEHVAEAADTLHTTILEIEASLANLVSQTSEREKMANKIQQKATFAKKETSDSAEHTNQFLTRANEKLQQAITDAKAVREIETLVSTIMDLASQTNLLALNASIESSRSNDASNGFAVIAKEIRELSERTKENAENIQQVVHKIMLSVSELTNSSQELSSFIATNVVDDYRKFLQTTDQYGENATYLSSVTVETRQATEEISQAVLALVAQVETIDHSSKNSSKEVRVIFDEVENTRRQTQRLADSVQSLQKDSQELEQAMRMFTL